MYAGEADSQQGTYQGQQRYYFVEGGRAEKLVFPVMVPDEKKRWSRKSTEVLLGLPGVDVKKQRLTMLEKFRGPGDCGIFTTWSLAGQHPILVECRANLDCDADPPRLAPDWPRVPLGR